MKRIAFDLRCLPSDGSPGAGIAHAARELFYVCTQYATWFGIECVGYAHEGAFVLGEGMVRRLPFANGFGSSRALWRMIQDDACDGFFAPTGSVSLGCPTPSFAWVHDVEIFSHPEWFPQGRWRRYFTTHVFLYGLRHAHHVFCVSEDTQKKVLGLVPALRDRVSVTLEGVEVPISVMSKRKRSYEVLILGSVEPRKNISFITTLWLKLFSSMAKPPKLIIAGHDGWGRVDIPSHPLIERLSNVSDEQRNALLGQVQLVLVPSFHEGFGRVALEAMAHGTPVIVSAVGAHPEVVGDGGILLDALDEKGWREAITYLLDDEEAWNHFHHQGLIRARNFTWKRVAEAMLAVMAKSC